MNRRQKQSGAPSALSVIAGLLISAISTAASAQGLLYSFENGLEGWEPTGYSGTRLVSVGTSTLGATDGLQSMAVETGGNFSWDVRTNVDSSDSARYALFNAVAHDLTKYSLDFDVTMAPDSFANVSDPGNYFLLSVAVNSSLNNFATVYNVSPNLTGATGTFPISIPMNNLPIGVDSGYYQVNLNANSNQVNGPAGEGVKYYIDNMRFTKTPTVIPHTLFSWETPDDSGTTINEQFEGWTQGSPGFAENVHIHSISTLGATDGTHSLQIDRTATESGFTWGSQFALSGGEANPENQAVIDQLVSTVNSGQSIAFDVRFDDSFPNTPTFTKFGLHITDHRSDDTYSFFQAEGQSFDGVQTIGNTGTVIIPLANLLDSSHGTLADAKLTAGTDFLRFGISVNTDGGGIYQIDNFRVLSTIALDADFNGDEVVDANDLTAWKIATVAHTAAGDADNDGDSDGNDFLIWQRELGNGAAATALASAVPEPTALLLAGLAACACRRRRRR